MDLQLRKKLFVQEFWSLQSEEVVKYLVEALIEKNARIR